jgi:hypothetical protein
MSDDPTMPATPESPAAALAPDTASAGTGATRAAIVQGSLFPDDDAQRVAAAPAAIRVVEYGGTQITIDDPKLSLEQIRQRLEPQFPELTKDRTRMVVDPKTHHIIPQVTAAKKGARPR